MARPLRLEFPGAVYHITARGNERREIFSDDIDRECFLDLLGREVAQQGWVCLAYCLMSNHYHLLIETPQPTLVQGMRRLNGTYTQAYNRRHGRVGHLLQGRYKSILVDRDSYLLELCRYIVLNPLRAQMVTEPSRYAWSSYRATVGSVPPPSWLQIDVVLAMLPGHQADAAARYAEFVRQGECRASPWSELRGQMWLGDASFRQRMERLARKAEGREIPSAQLRPTRPTGEEVLDSVAVFYGVELSAITGRLHRNAYCAAAYLLRRAANLPLGRVAALFSVSPSRISRIQAGVEQGEYDLAFTELAARFGIAATGERKARECKVKN